MLSGFIHLPLELSVAIMRRPLTFPRPSLHKANAFQHCVHLHWSAETFVRTFLPSIALYTLFCGYKVTQRSSLYTHMGKGTSREGHVMRRPGDESSLSNWWSHWFVSMSITKGPWCVYPLWGATMALTGLFIDRFVKTLLSWRLCSSCWLPSGRSLNWASWCLWHPMRRQCGRCNYLSRPDTWGPTQEEGSSRPRVMKEGRRPWCSDSTHHHQLQWPPEDGDHWGFTEALEALALPQELWLLPAWAGSRELLPWPPTLPVASRSHHQWPQPLDPVHLIAPPLQDFCPF